MSTALAVIQHQQDTHPGSTTGTSTPATKHFAAEQLIAITGETLLEHMCRKLTVLTNVGTLFRYAAVVTTAKVHLRSTRNSFQSQVTFKRGGIYG